MAVNCEAPTAHDKPRPFEKRPCTDRQTVPQSIPSVPATMTNATFEEFKGKDSLFVSEWLRQNGLEKPLRGI